MASTRDELTDNRAGLDAMFRADAFANHLGVVLEDWGGGWSRVSLEVTESHRNFAGWLHGGVTFGLGDVAFAVASNSWGRLCVALSVDVQFLASVDVGTTLVATARERHRTARTGAYLMEVHARPAEGPASTGTEPGRSVPGGPLADDHDGSSRLVGSLHALVHRSSRWHLGEDAWSRAWRAAH